MKDKNKIFIALALLFGLGLNGYFIGRALKHFKGEDRFISVKGFSEREVKANFAVWTIKTRITTNDLVEGSREMELNKTKVVSFLLNNEIKKEEVIQKNLSVTDKLAQEYVNSNMGGFRYLIENSIQVRSENVDKIQQVSRLTDELLKAGIVISNNREYQPAVQYLFTGLNDIKPQMLSEATQNAKKAAIEFTKQSDVVLGNLRKASQGLFSIIDRDASISSQSGESGYGTNVNDIYKKVKVVVNVEYAIK